MQTDHTFYTLGAIVAVALLIHLVAPCHPEPPSITLPYGMVCEFGRSLPTQLGQTRWTLTCRDTEEYRAILGMPAPAIPEPTPAPAIAPTPPQSPAPPATE